MAAAKGIEKSFKSQLHSGLAARRGAANNFQEITQKTLHIDIFPAEVEEKVAPSPPSLFSINPTNSQSQIWLVPPLRSRHATANPTLAISPWAHQFAHPSSIFVCHILLPFIHNNLTSAPFPLFALRPWQTHTDTDTLSLRHCCIAFDAWAKVSCLYSFIVYKCLISAATLNTAAPPPPPLPCWTTPEPLLNRSSFTDRWTRAGACQTVMSRDK